MHRRTGRLWPDRTAVSAATAGRTPRDNPHAAGSLERAGAGTRVAGAGAGDTASPCCCRAREPIVCAATADPSLIMLREHRAATAPFHYRKGELHAEAVALNELAVRFDTPLYVYSRQAVEQAYARFEQALAGTPHQICYAVKANGSLALLRLLAKLGAGFDIVSGGELERVLRAGGKPETVVFSGVGKREIEIRRALAVGIRCFNVESAAELERINAIALGMQKTARVALRINPEIQAQTHPHIHTGHSKSKFGIHAGFAEQVVRRALDLQGVRLVGLTCHIGSQITDLAPYTEAWRCVARLADRYAEFGAPLEHLDFGGGFGIRYRDESIPDLGEFAAVAREVLGDRELQLLIEPGRALVGAAGILLTRVEYVKTTPYAKLLVTDAGMTELLRPALYDAWHDVREVTPGTETALYDVVGPVCESADVLARERRLAIGAGGLLAIMDCGAYGASMGSNYNSRPRPAEVLVDGARVELIRRRETCNDLMALDILPDER